MNKFQKLIFQNAEGSVFEKEPRLIQNVFDTKELRLKWNRLTSFSINRLETCELYGLQERAVFHITMLLVSNLGCQRSPICELDLCQYTYHTQKEFAVRNIHALYG